MHNWKKILRKPATALVSSSWFLHGLTQWVLSFSPVVGFGTPPTPNPQASVPPPPLVLGGGAHSLAKEGARGWKSPNSDDGRCTVLWYSIHLYALCGLTARMSFLLLRRSARPLRSANASLVGANKVRGRLPARLRLRPAADIALTRVLNLQQA